MKVIIIGGIAAGMSAAAKLKRVCKDADVLLFEKNAYISFGACGLPYFAGGFFENENQMFARTPEKAEKAGIRVFTEHEVLKVNIDLSSSDEKSIMVKNLKDGSIFTESYDKLMIATGANPIIPPIKNVNLENVHVLRSLEDGRAIREKLADDSIQKVSIVGAGFIGLEVVEAAKNMGKEVSVFQLESRILNDTFDSEITDILEAELQNQNVNLYRNTMVTALEGTAQVTHVVTDKGRVDADFVILATGVRPNTGFLKDTGLSMLPNGAIIINQKGETSIKDIYAAGDCATVHHVLKNEPAYIPLATSANKLGRIVGENLGGMDSEFEGTLGSSCLKVLQMEAGRTGLSEMDAKKMGLSYRTIFITDKNHTDYYPGQEPISIKLIYDSETKVILGGQIVGKSDAVQRTNVLAAAIMAKMTTKQLGMLDLCYAPPFARTWDALNIAGNAGK